MARLSLAILRGREPGSQVGTAELFFDEDLAVRIRLDPDSDAPDPQPGPGGASAGSLADVDVHLQAQLLLPHERPVDDSDFTVFEGTLPAAAARELAGGAREWTQRIHVNNTRSHDPAQLEVVVTAVRPRPVAGAPGRSKLLTSLEPVSTHELGLWNLVDPDGAADADDPDAHDVHAAAPRDARRTAAASAAPAAGAPANDAAATAPPTPTPDEHALALSTLTHEMRMHARNDQDIAYSITKLTVVPVLNMSLRSVRPVLEKERVIAQLDVSAQRALLVRHLDVSLAQGTVAAISAPALPLAIAENAGHSFCYNLETLVVSTSSGIHSKATIALEYDVPLDDGAVSAWIKTAWVSPVDFQDAAGPLPKTPTLGSLPSPKLGRRSSNVSLASLASSVPASSVAEQRGRERVPLSGVSVFLSGPNNVKLGAVFEWKVMVINRSSRARKLALNFYSKEATPAPFVSRLEERALVADLPTLQRRIDAHQASLGGDSGLIPLNSELRVGVLAPYSCFESAVRLKAVSPGRHCVDASTVVDLSTGDTYDTSELLEVMVDV